MSQEIINVRCPKCGQQFVVEESEILHPSEPVKMPNFTEISIHDKGRLPHWDAAGGFYFVTYRLADSLPGSILKSVKAECNKLQSQTRMRGIPLTTERKKRISLKLSKRIEKSLDEGYGSCILADPGIAEIVANSLTFFDADRYRLFSWCVMPNHVHVVFKLLPGQILSKLMHSWKSFTAKEINKVLDNTGTVWEREYFDRLIRNEAHFLRAIRYVIDNPVKAGLKDWRWVWMREQDVARVG